MDHQDYQHLQRCFGVWPCIDGTLQVGCSVLNFGNDVDLDPTDYHAFQSAVTGATALNNNPKGPE